jgi:hypothetical protein
VTDNAPRKSAAKPSIPGKRVMPDSRYLAEYREAGLELIPLHKHDYRDQKGRPRGKSPRDGAWPVRDYTNFDAEAHMTEGGNVGVRLTAEWVVLDADPRNYPDGRNCLDEVACKLGYADGEAFCDDNAHVVTGSGGFHIYMRKALETELVDSLKEHPGIEFKSLGRQVVAAGSVHPDTHRIYRLGEFLELPFTKASSVPTSLIEIAGRKDSPIPTPGSGLKLSVAQVHDCLRQLLPEAFQDYDDWLHVGMECHAATDGDPAALAEWIEWSTDPGDAEYKWTTFKADRPGRRLTGWSLFRLVEAHGGILPPHELDDDEFEPVTEADLAEVLRVEAFFKSAAKQRRLGAADDGQEFRWLTLDELEALGPPEWLIEGILPRWSYGMLYGPSGSGKSFLALEMAICVAIGADFHGRATRATGGAFYVAAEDPRDFPIREKAWRKHHDVEGRPAVRFLEGSLTLNLPSKAEKLAASIHQVDPEPGIIVIDTLSATFEGNENTDDVKTFLAACRTLRDKTKATVVFVHHTGKDEGREHLGSQHLRNDGDFVLRMDGDPQKAEAFLSAKKFKGAATPGALMNLVKTVVKTDDGRESLVLLEEAEHDFTGEPDEAIGIVAGFADGSKMFDIAAAVAKELGLGETAARNRVRKAFGIERGRPGDTGRAVEWGHLTLRLERSDRRNINSGLILRADGAS